MDEEPQGSPEEDQPQRPRWGAARKPDAEEDMTNASAASAAPADAAQEPEKKKVVSKMAGWRNKGAEEAAGTADAEPMRRERSPSPAKASAAASSAASAAAAAAPTAPEASDRQNLTAASAPATPSASGKSKAAKALLQNSMARMDTVLPPAEAESAHISQTAHWHTDPHKGHHIKVKVMIIGAFNLRPRNFQGVINTSCHCELLGGLEKTPKANTHWHTKILHNNKHPAWKEHHTWNETSFTPGDHIRFSIIDHERDIQLGAAIVSGKQFYPDGFEGKVELKEAREAGPDPHMKVRIMVESEEKKLAAEEKAKKAKLAEKEKAKKNAMQKGEDSMTPWEKRIAGLTQTSPRVAPGQVLKPRGTPVYKRLYQEHSLKQDRLQEKIDAQEKAEADYEDSLLHHLGAWVTQKGTEEEVDSVIDRLYSDADRRKERLQERINKQEAKLDEELGPRNQTEYDDPAQVILDLAERLHSGAATKKDKLEQKRTNVIEKELKYLHDNSVHEARLARDDERDEEVFERLHGDKVRLSHKIEEMQRKAHEDAVCLATNATARDLVEKYREEKTVRLTIVGAKNLVKPAQAQQPEPFCVCAIPAAPGAWSGNGCEGERKVGKPGGKMRTKPVRWKDNVMWNQEFDLTDVYDCEGPLTLTVVAGDHPADHVLGTAVLDSSIFSANGFDGEIQLMPPDSKEEPLLLKLKAQLRKAGYFLGGVSLRKLHRHCDHDGSGGLCLTELKNSIRKDGKLTKEMISDANIKRVFDEVDKNGDGQICFEEFVAWLDISKKAAPQAQIVLPKNEKIDAGNGVALDGVASEKAELSPADPGSPGAPQQAEPEPSPQAGKTTFGEVVSLSPAAPSSPVAPVEKVALPATLVIKIQILQQQAQGKRAFLERSVQRLYGKHFEQRDKFESMRDVAERRMVKKASPFLGPHAMPKLEGEALQFYQKLYNDAHRRHVDRRMLVKESLRKLQLAQDADSVHSAALSRKDWQPKDINQIFERVYNPPPKAFKIKLHTPTHDQSFDEDSPSSEPEVTLATPEAHIIQTPEPLPPRRMGIFFNRDFGEEQEEPEQTFASSPISPSDDDHQHEQHSRHSVRHDVGHHEASQRHGHSHHSGHHGHGHHGHRRGHHRQGQDGSASLQTGHGQNGRASLQTGRHSTHAGHRGHEQGHHATREGQPRNELARSSMHAGHQSARDGHQSSRSSMHGHGHHTARDHRREDSPEKRLSSPGQTGASSVPTPPMARRSIPASPSSGSLNSPVGATMRQSLSQNAFSTMRAVPGSGTPSRSTVAPGHHAAHQGGSAPSGTPTRHSLNSNNFSARQQWPQAASAPNLQERPPPRVSQGSGGRRFPGDAPSGPQLRQSQRAVPSPDIAEFDHGSPRKSDRKGVLISGRPPERVSMASARSDSPRISTAPAHTEPSAKQLQNRTASRHTATLAMAGGPRSSHGGGLRSMGSTGSIGNMVHVY